MCWPCRRRWPKPWRGRAAAAAPPSSKRKCERLTGHLIHDAQGYRSKEELQQAWQRCPIQLFGQRLQQEGVLAADELARMSAEIEAEVAAAVDHARAQPFPAAHEAYEDLWA